MLATTKQIEKLTTRLNNQDVIFSFENELLSLLLLSQMSGSFIMLEFSLNISENSRSKIDNFKRN